MENGRCFVRPQWRIQDTVDRRPLLACEPRSRDRYAKSRLPKSAGTPQPGLSALQLAFQHRARRWEGLSCLLNSVFVLEPETTANIVLSETIAQGNRRCE